MTEKYLLRERQKIDVRTLALAFEECSKFRQTDKYRKTIPTLPIAIVFPSSRNVKRPIWGKSLKASTQITPPEISN